MFPGGRRRGRESAKECLRREIKEETNLEVSDIEFVLVQDCIHSKEFYRDAHFVLLNYTCKCAGIPKVALNDEAREFRWVTLEDALELPIVVCGPVQPQTQRGERRSLQSP